MLVVIMRVYHMFFKRIHLKFLFFGVFFIFLILNYAVIRIDSLHITWCVFIFQIIMISTWKIQQPLSLDYSNYKIFPLSDSQIYVKLLLQELLSEKIFILIIFISFLIVGSSRLSIAILPTFLFYINHTIMFVTLILISRRKVKFYKFLWFLSFSIIGGLSGFVNQTIIGVLFFRTVDLGIFVYIDAFLQSKINYIIYFLMGFLFINLCLSYVVFSWFAKKYPFVNDEYKKVFFTLGKIN